jgi:hypothetical protein
MKHTLKGNRERKKKMEDTSIMPCVSGVENTKQKTKFKTNDDRGKKVTSGHTLIIREKESNCARKDHVSAEPSFSKQRGQ